MLGHIVDLFIRLTLILGAANATPVPTEIPTIIPEPVIRPATSTPSPRPYSEPTPSPRPSTNRTQQSTTSTVLATRYGVQYNGQTMGCGGTYTSGNSSILAVGPSRYGEIPCGTGVTLTNPNTGVQLSVLRVDSCPGCGYGHIDLSEAGIAILCGYACDRIEGIIMTIP